MVKERLKKVPKGDLKRFFVPKEKSKDISQESYLLYLYAENIRASYGTHCSKKDGRVVGGIILKTF